MLSIFTTQNFQHISSQQKLYATQQCNTMGGLKFRVEPGVCVGVMSKVSGWDLVFQLLVFEHQSQHLTPSSTLKPTPSSTHDLKPPNVTGSTSFIRSHRICFNMVYSCSMYLKCKPIFKSDAYFSNTLRNL